ncbi:hypothetical protein V498_05012 [Pseudogymnoascus sp. VKM F-4517 (FW-2822)]|nr:hypothetical protein V498_05012 [Pseudogymnoascus sp. VKM F-4517 (FW-2822)]
MRSHLTRTVFRRLLRNEGFNFRCPHRPALQSLRCGAVSALQPSARRHVSVFGFSPKPERGIKDPDMDPGFSTLLDLGLMNIARARSPPADDLAKAFRQFVAHKAGLKEPINTLQASYVLRTFQHLRDTNAAEPDFGLKTFDLKRARDAMKILPAKPSSDHVDFAREVFEELRRRAGKENPGALLVEARDFVKVLTATGNTLEARDYLVQYLSEGRELNDHGSKQVKTMWLYVMDGFSAEGNEAELAETFNMASASGLQYDAAVQDIMTSFYASKNNVVKAKEWFTKPIAPKANEEAAYPRASTLLSILHFALRNNELEWLNPIFRSIVQSNPDKANWDVILLWAAEGLEKGPEEVERMMDVMARHNDESYKQPDMDTFNKLVESAISRKNHYLAERYIALAERRGIRPNAKTYIMQMDYRIDAQDLSGAQGAYDALRAEDLSERQDIRVANKYIRALCSASSPNYDKIMSVVTDLEERNVRLEADTLSSLVILHLKRGDMTEVVNSLQRNVFHHDLEDRDRTRDAIFDYCLDRSNSTAQVWDAYTVLRSVYPETGRELRTRLMTEFFDRRRSDMACHAFGHMRQHDIPEIRPNIDTYVACFLGIGKCADEESLDMVHNMMKMDSTVEPSTKLYNSLMAAFTAVGDADRALDFWIDVTNSREGPSYASLEMVFRACEKNDFGEKPAKEIWGTMKRMEIEITPEVFNAYVGALAGQGLGEEVKKLIEGMEEDVDFGPDVNTLGIFYNVVPGQTKKDSVETWGQTTYPEVWAELEKIGKVPDADDDYEVFNIVREWKA